MTKKGEFQIEIKAKTECSINRLFQYFDVRVLVKLAWILGSSASLSHYRQSILVMSSNRARVESRKLRAMLQIQFKELCLHLVVKGLCLRSEVAEPTRIGKPPIDKIRKHGAEEFRATTDDDPKRAKF
ncbi:Protein MCM10 [Gossypium australe]|uniref:Protein MCM10 n=1 Tax=Gossypium australe TaxID=47621 RepID=A0A5B6VWG5_9ROSI|nr:Protein MCM10 [Gossypium australe]